MWENKTVTTLDITFDVKRAGVKTCVGGLILGIFFVLKDILKECKKPCLCQKDKCGIISVESLGADS